jgi:hypothetical protein
MADCSKEFAAATCRAFGGHRDSPSHGLRAVLTAQVDPAPSLALSRRAYSGRSRTRLLRLPASTIRFHRRTCLAFRPASSLGARSVARPRGERGDTGPAGPPGEAGNSNLRAFDVDKDIASCREDEIAVSAICKNEVAPTRLDQWKSDLQRRSRDRGARRTGQGRHWFERAMILERVNAALVRAIVCRSPAGFEPRARWSNLPAVRSLATADRMTAGGQDV